MVNSDLRSPQSGQNGVRFRSCLIVDASDRKEAFAALGGEASALFIRLGGSYEESRRAGARAIARDLLNAARRAGAPETYVQVAPTESGAIDRDLDEIIVAAPDGVLLEEARGRAAVQHLSAKLSVREAEAGLAEGATKILALIQAPAAIFALAGFAGSSRRLAGLVFDEDAFLEKLSQDAGSSFEAAPNGAPSPFFSVFVARSLIALGAAAASVAAIGCARKRDDEEAFAARCRALRNEGYWGAAALRRSQLAAANSTFQGRSEG